MQEIEPSEVPFEFFFQRKNNYFQILASVHVTPVQRNKTKQASRYCSDLLWTRKFLAYLCISLESANKKLPTYSGSHLH